MERPGLSFGLTESIADAVGRGGEKIAFEVLRGLSMPEPFGQADKDIVEHILRTIPSTEKSRCA